MEEGTQDKRFHQEFMNTESQFGYTSTQLIIRRVDSTFNGCEIESPSSDIRKRLFQDTGGNSPHRPNSGKSYQDLSPSRKRWKKMSTVFKTIYFLKNPQVKKIENPQVFVEELRNHPSKKSYTSHSSTAALNTVSRRTKDALKEVRKMEHIFELLSLGGPHNREEFLTELQNDPKKDMYENSHPNRLSNKKNPSGQTPLYVACLNGHEDFVEILMNEGANPFILSTVDHKEQESILSVSVRWGHTNIVKMLLQKVEWPKTLLRSALRQRHTLPRIQKYVQAEYKRRFGRLDLCCFRLFTCS